MQSETALTLYCNHTYTVQTMDNMDGKQVCIRVRSPSIGCSLPVVALVPQARKIGASSPLGMLFDHVCDAINSGTLLQYLNSILFLIHPRVHRRD